MQITHWRSTARPKLLSMANIIFKKRLRSRKQNALLSSSWTSCRKAQCLTLNLAASSGRSSYSCHTICQTLIFISPKRLRPECYMRCMSLSSPPMKALNKIFRRESTWTAPNASLLLILLLSCRIFWLLVQYRNWRSQTFISLKEAVQHCTSIFQERTWALARFYRSRAGLILVVQNATLWVSLSNSFVRHLECGKS